MPRTPGLIHHNPNLSRPCQEMVYGADGNLLANVGSHRRTPEEDTANAEHMVACWNACENMKDPVAALETVRSNLREALEHMGRALTDERECVAIALAALGG